MLSLLSNPRVYLAASATDLRKSFDPLAGVVRSSLPLDPLSIRAELARRTGNSSGSK